MAKQGIDLDQDLAEVINEQRLRHLSILREMMTNKLQQECDAHEKELSKAWETIQSSLTVFQKKKDNMFATLAQFEGEERAREVFGASQKDVVPPTLRAIPAYFTCKPNNVLFLPTPTSATATESMHKFETRENITAVGALSRENGVGPISPGGNQPETDVPAKSGSVNGVPSKFYAKRSRTQFDFGASSKNKKAKTTNPGDRELTPTSTLTKKPDIDSWEVEGSEYIFQYPAFGAGYFVLRCGLGSISEPHTFTAHPFENALAMEHFNDYKTCKGHDTTRQYQPDDIVSLHGHRVRGENVKEEWVIAANMRLSADKAKSTTPRPKTRKPLEIVSQLGPLDLQYRATPRSTPT
ncbi:hypothetical protein B0T26DRAFT_797226 [Lasiosphaeria miniovina]|uniref:Uncharacterized protein n=1 Tax=Lasiosphaeria miniovina TaxID=1954250 RepID=A0AA40ECD2_9PEZI|nr:uncharacterized protein B0T26DRAFT_797226 [Lasiosphaeria miniovina]KAK0733117.1 hypothetical protein B0T26DRAFT_797226 [Lasiosphaeria miniovina]